MLYPSGTILKRRDRLLFILAIDSPLDPAADLPAVVIKNDSSEGIFEVGHYTRWNHDLFDKTDLKLQFDIQGHMDNFLSINYGDMVQNIHDGDLYLYVKPTSPSTQQYNCVRLASSRNNPLYEFSCIEEENLLSTGRKFRFPKRYM